jgi:hypothetical protein
VSQQTGTSLKRVAAVRVTIFTALPFYYDRARLCCVGTGTQDSRPPECVIPDDVLTQFDPSDDEHLLLETCRGVK